MSTASSIERARLINRRRFLHLSASGIALPALLAACGSDDDPVSAVSDSTTSTTAEATATTEAEAAEQAEAIVGDVVDFALTSDEWAGPFGFVTMAVHRGAVDGSDVYFVRTDSSDKTYAEDNELVFVPKLAGLTGDGLSNNAYVVTDDPAAPTVFSTEPGRDDYSPAWTLHLVTWSTEPQPLLSEQDILDAETAGAVTVERTDIVVNAGMLKWSDGEMPVDTVREAYLGDGQLLEPVDTTNLRATLKLNQCFPASRYFALDHSLEGPATNTNTVWSPKLDEGPSAAGATGVTNVFANGIAGLGPMGFQPSAFDFDAGDAAWSPYWDHFTYRWADESDAEVLTTMAEIHAARDAGNLEEFVGAPPTNGKLFTVNCPVPVLAPVTWTPA